MKKSGFTLIELLVVISIIALLSSVVLGQISQGREKAAITQLKESGRQFVTAMELYRQDNGAYYGATDTWLDANTEVIPALSGYIGDGFELNADGISSFDLSTASFASGFGYLHIASGAAYTIACGSGTQTQNYAIFFQITDSSIDISSDFPALYSSGVQQAGYYCIIDTSTR